MLLNPYTNSILWPSIYSCQKGMEVELGRDGRLWVLQ